MTTRRRTSGDDDITGGTAGLDAGPAGTGLDTELGGTASGTDGGRFSGGSPVIDDVQQRTTPIAERVRDTTTTQLESQKQRATEGLGSVAEAVRETAQRLREHQQEPLAGAAETAAQQVERFSGYLRDRDVNSLVRDAEDFARRQPALFVAGAFVLGVAAGRFLKSSSRAAQGAGVEPMGYDRGSYATSGYDTDYASAGYGAAGTTGHGTAAGADYGTAGATDYGTTGATGYGTAGTAGADDYATAGAGDYATAGATDAGGTGYGATGAADYGTAGAEETTWQGGTPEDRSTEGRSDAGT